MHNPINPNPAQIIDGTPYYETEYTDLEDVIIDAIGSRFETDQAIEMAAAIMEDLFEKYEIKPKKDN